MSMQVEHYQHEAGKTSTPYIVASRRFTGRGSIYEEPWIRLAYLGLKLSGEAGEVSEKIGKQLRDMNGIITDKFTDDLIKELGDVQWYIANICSELGITLETVMQRNLDKLADRQQRGVLQGSGDDR